MTGGGNVFLGYNAGYNETGSNMLYIENSDGAAPLIYGEFDNDIIGLNATVNIRDVLKLKPQASAPSGTLGSLFVSSSTSKLYFHDGTQWMEVNVSVPGKKD